MGINQSMKIPKNDLLRLIALDESELTPLLYTYFDQDLSKEISKDEFSRLWLDLRPKSTVELELYFFPAMDMDHNGLLSYQEFIVIYIYLYIFTFTVLQYWSIIILVSTLDWMSFII